MTVAGKMAAGTILTAAMFVGTSAYPDIMTVGDLGHLMFGMPGEKIYYGEEPLQFGEFHVPQGAGPHPVIVFIHGGCWLGKYDLTDSRPLATAMKESGFAVWNLEYRRVGNPGGGYPGTLLDVGTGTDHLRVLAQTHPLDLSRVVLMGHSAGGHLALWTAARRKIPTEHLLHQPDPIAVNGVVALAPASDLAFLHKGKQCDHVVDKLLGGSPKEVPERYRFADTAQMAPIGVPQILILGDHDTAWTPVARAYLKSARAAGDVQITPIAASESGHFEMIDPGTSTFSLVLKSARSVANIK